MYENISDLLNNNNIQIKIVMGDCNAKIGRTKGDEEAICQFGMTDVTVLLNSPVETNPLLLIPYPRNVDQEDGHREVQMG